MDEVSPGIWRQRLPLPPDHPESVSVYAVEDSDGTLHLIDAGWSDAANRRALRSAYQQLVPKRRVQTVLVTHHHADHAGAGGWVRRLTGARVMMHPLEKAFIDDQTHGRGPSVLEELRRWGVPRQAGMVIDEGCRAASARSRPIVVDALVDHGERVPVPGRDLQILHTPGHTAGHICVVDHTSRSVFTGDHVLPTTTPGIGLGGDLGVNPLQLYYTSLDEVSRLEGYTAYPSHGEPFLSVRERAAAIRTRFARRTAEVEAELARRPRSTPWQIATNIRWSRPWESMTGEVQYQALTQTTFHLRYLGAASV